MFLSQTHPFGIKKDRFWLKNSLKTKGAVAKVKFCCGSFSHKFSTFKQQKRGEKPQKVYTKIDTP